MKKPVIYAVMCHKGGTGKTTTISALADAFARLGKKVLIIDADEQSNIKTILELSFKQETVKGVLRQSFLITSIHRI